MRTIALLKERRVALICARSGEAPSNSREKRVSPPRLRIWACSTQFSRAMRPPVWSCFSKASISDWDHCAICA